MLRFSLKNYTPQFEHFLGKCPRLKNGDMVYRPPKAAKGRRIVSLSPSTTLVLKKHLESQKALRLLSGHSLKEDDLIFSTIDGNPIHPNLVTLAWTRLAKRTCLEEIRLHDATHTHASLMLKQGIHPNIVRERLGHSSIQIALDTYSHVAPGLQAAAAKGFDSILIKSEDSPQRLELLQT